MPRFSWPLLHGRPRIQIELVFAIGGQRVVRDLIADSGAGSSLSLFDLIMDEHDCLLCGAVPAISVPLGGTYTGTFPVYNLDIEIPQLSLHRRARVVGVPSTPVGFDGLACFRFLNRFAYGNFGDPARFGIEL